MINYYFRYLNHDKIIVKNHIVKKKNLSIMYNKQNKFVIEKITCKTKNKRREIEHMILLNKYINKMCKKNSLKIK